MKITAIRTVVVNAEMIQPDLCHCGGLLLGKKIAAMAETCYMGIAPHNPLCPWLTRECCISICRRPNFLIQEDILADVSWRWGVVQHSLQTGDG